MEKIIITNKHNNIIVDLVDTTKIVSNGLLVTNDSNEYILGYYKKEDYNIFDKIIIPEGIKIQKYCYDSINGFVLNSNYIEPPKPLEEQVTELQNTINILLGGIV